jgi:hypothetical protein
LFKASKLLMKTGIPISGDFPATDIEKFIANNAYPAKTQDSTQQLRVCYQGCFWVKT